MQDKAAIQDVITAYCQSIGLGDRDMTLATFLPDGIWELRNFGVEHQGHEAIRAALDALTGPMDYIVQLNAPALIEVTGDRATARYTIRECGRLAGAQQGFESFGVYFDDLMRAADGWKFARHCYRPIGVHAVILGG
jgi:hypothetical protein